MASLPLSPRRSKSAVGWRMNQAGRWEQVKVDSPTSTGASSPASAGLSCRAGESTTAVAAAAASRGASPLVASSAQSRRGASAGSAAASPSSSPSSPPSSSDWCELCSTVPSLAHPSSSPCPFECGPARELRLARGGGGASGGVPWGSQDFLPLERFIDALLLRTAEKGQDEEEEGESGGQAEWALPFEESDLRGAALAQARQVLLLTLPYHSAPVDLLRRLLTRLRTPPPPSPYEAASGVFATEGDGEAAVRTEDSEAETDDLASDAHATTTPTKPRPSRSADVAIVSRGAKAVQPAGHVRTQVQAHARRMMMMQQQQQHPHSHGAFEDPLLCFSPSTSLSTSASVGSASSALSAASSLPSPSTSASSSEPCSASHAHTTPPRTSGAQMMTPSSSTDVSVATSSESQTRSLPLVVDIDVTALHMRVSAATAPLISAAPPSTRALARVMAFQQWHASKLHVLQLLHSWLQSHPQDFCCLPYELSPPAFDAPRRRPLGELLHAHLAAFPPKEWLRPASWGCSVNSSPSLAFSSPGGGGGGVRRGPLSLDARMWDSMRRVSEALCRAWETSRDAYGPGPDYTAATLSPLGATPTQSSPASSLSSSSEQGMSPLLLSASSPALLGRAAAAAAAAAAAHSPTPPSTTRRALTASGNAASPSSQPQQVSSPPPLQQQHGQSPNSWNQSWGNNAVHRNLESSLKLQRMMMQQGEGRTSTSGTGPNGAAPAVAAAGANSAAVPSSASPSLSSSSPSSRVAMASSPSMGPLVYATIQALHARSTAEFLAIHPRSYASALTWLAIQRMQQIGNCAREEISSLTSLVGGAVPSVSLQHPAPLASASFLRLFLRMPAHLSRAQMRMSNTFSCFVATTVLRAPSVSTRRQVVRHWIDVAHACLHQQLGHADQHAQQQAPSAAPDAPLTNPNFMHAFEIIYGINHQSVYRLPATQVGPDGRLPSPSAGSLIGALSAVARRSGGGGAHALLPLLHKRNFLSTHSYEVYTRLTRLTSPTGNYREYRKALQAAQDALLPSPSASSSGSGTNGGGAGAGALPPRFFIPYLGILLKDLVGLEDAGKPLAGMACAAVTASATEEEEEAEEEAELAQEDVDLAQGEEEEGRDQSRTRITRGASAGPSARPSLADSDPVSTVPSRTTGSPNVTSASPTQTTLAVTTTAADGATDTSAPCDDDSDLHAPMMSPTGSLPWDDSFLARPRRNATLRPGQLGSAPLSNASHRRGGGGSTGSVLGQLAEEESEEDVFASTAPTDRPHRNGSAPSALKDASTAALPRQSTSAPVQSATTSSTRDNLLHMLTEESSNHGANGPFPKLPPAATATAAHPNHTASKVSLLSAALPARQAKGHLALLAAAATSTGTANTMGSSASPSHSRTGSADRRALAPQQPPPGCLLVNYSKLSKVSTITSATLRCRFFLPQLPHEAEEGQEQQDGAAGGTTRPTAPSVAPTSQAESDAESAFADLLAQAALSPAVGSELRAAAVPSATQSAVPLGSSSAGNGASRARPSALAFDRRVQHWLMSNMLTQTLLEESQLMERSYQLFPRKQPAPNAAAAAAQ